MLGVATWMKMVGLGAFGVRTGSMFTCLGRRSPLRRLQGAQQVTMLSQVDAPPLERGMTWSTVRLPRSCPQYWQVQRSRANTARRGSFGRGGARRGGPKLHTPVTTRPGGSANVGPVSGSPASGRGIRCALPATVRRFLAGGPGGDRVRAENTQLLDPGPEGRERLADGRQPGRSLEVREEHVVTQGDASWA